jgi:hypothetical protein
LGYDIENEVWINVGDIAEDNGQAHGTPAPEMTGADTTHR